MSSESRSLAFARFYTQRWGLHVVPVPAGSKDIKLPGWQKLRLDVADLAQHFANGANVGVLNGEPSGGQIDVDLDVPEAVEAAAVFLPPTARVSGRAGNPNSHRFYKVTAPIATRQYRDIDGDMLVELRSTGSQTLLPPSKHPDGETYRWERHDEPATIAPEVLAAGVARLATAALLARHWPGKGSRHATGNALCATLLRAVWEPHEAEGFTNVVARVAGDPEWRTRGDGAGATLDKLKRGKPVTGIPALVDLLTGDSRRVVDRALDWLGIEQQEQPTGQPLMPTPAIDAPKQYTATMGIYESAGHLWRGLVELVDAESRTVDWLWPGRIPLGKLTLADGDPDLGKSVLFGADVAARVTQGDTMPDGTPGLFAPAGVVLISGEDDVEDTLKPRLEAAGADLTRVLAIRSVPRWVERDTEQGTERTPEEGTFAIPRDLEWLRAVIQHKQARYVLVDPLVAFLPPDRVNSWRDQDVRAALAPLARLAADEACAIVAIRHLTKSAASNPLYRGSGSVGIIGAARSALLIAPDPDDATGARRILARLKGNLAAPVPALAYHIAVTAGGVPYIAWEGLAATNYNATQLLAVPTDADSRTETDEACDWLRAILEDAGGSVLAKEAQDRARREGITDKALRMARLRICEKPARAGFGPGAVWSWHLKPEPQPGQTEQSEQSEQSTEQPLMPSAPLMPIGAYISNEGNNEGAGHQWEKQAHGKSGKKHTTKQPAPAVSAVSAYEQGVWAPSQYMRVGPDAPPDTT